MSKRIELVRNRIHSMGIDGVIITNPINVRYILGVQAEGTLIINQKTAEFITDARYIEAVNKTLTIEDQVYVQDIMHLTEDDYIRIFADCNKVGFEDIE